MDHLEPNLEAWLAEQEAEAERVKRMADWRERQAAEMLLHINHARILLTRMRNDGRTDLSEVDALVAKIKELRSKIGR